MAPEDTVADLLPRLNQTTVAVVTNGKLVGIVTPNDVVRSMRHATTGDLSRRRRSGDGLPG